MSSGQIEQKSYEMPPRDAFTGTQCFTVADIDRSARFFETIFDALCAHASRRVTFAAQGAASVGFWGAP